MLVNPATMVDEAQQPKQNLPIAYMGKFTRDEAHNLPQSEPQTQEHTFPMCLVIKS
jgi:hypothetical protein